ncbi:glycosyltransferase family 2 protein [bacterium]|nr:MAG: glycosyltransferase family 2 protein [bacterium]
MDNPVAITLLVPCFNAAQHLPRLLEATKRQTIPFHEIICYDDGSTDETVAIAKSYGAKVLQGTRNRGVAVARNKLLEATSTNWVHFHDSDDLMADNFVEVMSNLAAKASPNQPIAFICGQDEAKITPQTPYTAQLTYTNPHDFCALNTADQPKFFIEKFVHLNTAIFPTKALREVGGYCPYLRICEDVDMMVRLTAHGVRFQAIPDVLVTRVYHPSSLTKKTGSVERERYRLHYFNRCAKRLPSTYHPMLGEIALFYARRFYWQGHITDARRAIQLGKRCGVLLSKDTSRSHRLIAKVIGTEGLFWLLKRRSQLGRSST